MPTYEELSNDPNLVRNNAPGIWGAPFGEIADTIQSTGIMAQAPTPTPHVQPALPTPAAPKTYTPGSSGAPLASGKDDDPGKIAAGAGLGYAKGLLETGLNKTYEMPGDVSGLMKGPSQWDYAQFVEGPEFQKTGVAGWQGPGGPASFQNVDPNAQQAAFNRTGLPDFSQMMGGDYDKLQAALALPGEQAVMRGFDKSMIDLKNVMGGRGMYGSSVMGNQMVDAGTQMQEALAANAAQAAAQRYGMQQKDLQNMNEFGLARGGMDIGQEQFQTGQLQDLFKTNKSRELAQMEQLNKFGLAQDQMGLDTAKAAAGHAIDQSQVQAKVAQDEYRAGSDQQANMQNYMNSQLQFAMAQDEAQRGFGNQQIRDQFNYDMANKQWEQQINEMLMNQALALAGKGAPLASAQMASQSAIQAAQLKAQSDEDAALWGAIGTIGGAATPTVLDWIDEWW